MIIVEQKRFGVALVLGVIIGGTGVYLGDISTEAQKRDDTLASLYAADAALVSGDRRAVDTYRRLGPAMFPRLPAAEVGAVMGRPVPSDPDARADRIQVDAIYADMWLTGAGDASAYTTLALGMIGAAGLLVISAGLNATWSKPKASINKSPPGDT